MNSHITAFPAPVLSPSAKAWLDRLFDAQTARKGGIVRRSVSSVDREIGRDLFEYEVRRRRFHLLECGGQFIIICNSGRLQIIT